MKGRFAALLMAVLLALYIVLVGWRAVQFVMTGNPLAIAIGLSLIVLPIVGVWALIRELLFGVRTQRLVGVLTSEGGLPEEGLPTRASGRPLRDAADEDFAHYRAAVEQEPESWRAWFRLGLAYDASGDRRRARRAINTAITLERASGR